MRIRRRNRPDTTPLRLIGLDSQLRREELEVLALNTDMLRVPSGDVLARAGEVARQFIAIVDGDVEITDRFGRSTVAGPGTQIGASELATRSVHTANVITRSETTLVVIFGPAFRSAMRMSDRPSSIARSNSRTSHRRHALATHWHTPFTSPPGTPSADRSQRPHPTRVTTESPGVTRDVRTR